MKEQRPEDRRAHIRITDKILFKIKFIEETEYQQLEEKVLKGIEQPFEEFSLQWELPKIDVPARKLREKDENLAKALEVIDTKLNLIINLLNIRMRKNFPEEQVLVDMSASGIAFTSKEEIKKGSRSFPFFRINAISFLSDTRISFHTNNFWCIELFNFRNFLTT